MVLAVCVTVGMQRNAWILIVIGWGFSGQIHALSVPIAVRDIVVLVVVCTYVAQRAVLGQSVERSKGALGALVAINFCYFVFTFMLHPVGLHALGSETIGGRPYFNIFIGWCAYWILVHMPESYKSVSRIPLWLLASAAVSGILSLAVYVYPAMTPYVWFFYSDIDISAYLGSLHTSGQEPEVRRFFALGGCGVVLIRVLSAYCRAGHVTQPTAIPVLSGRAGICRHPRFGLPKQPAVGIRGSGVGLLVPPWLARCRLWRCGRRSSPRIRALWSGSLV